MTSDSKNENLGKIIKKQRVMMSLTMRELAERSGVSASHLGRIEREEQFPSARILRKIAKPLGFGEEELFIFANYLTSQSSTADEHKTHIGKLDPHVAGILSQESVEVQRAVIGILSILKSIAKVVE